MENFVGYGCCATCGKWMPLQAGSKQIYCSPECARENLCCPVCGRYFEKGSGTVAAGEVVCGADCGTHDPRYDHLFKELS